MTSPFRLALFDCDGTLVDGLHSIVAAMGEAWHAHGLSDPDPDAMRRVIGLPLDVAIAQLLPSATDDERKSIEALYRSAFFQRRQTDEFLEPLFPGAIEALDSLEADGFLLGVATGKSRRGLQATLESHGLLARFVTTQTADDCPGKPNPQMVQRAMTETGVEPSGVAVIGDTVFDIQMARAAGVASVGVAWGYHPADELSAAGAGAIAQAFPDVPRAVKLLLSG